VNTNFESGAFHHILVTLDGTPASLMAIPAAIQLGKAARKVTLLVVLADASLAGGESLDRIDRARGQVVEAMPAATVELSIVSGDPVDEILRAASRGLVDLVVMSHLERGLVPADAVRSISGNVASRSGVPVLVVRSSSGERATERGRSLPSRVVLPLDGSLRARQCLPVAAKLSRTLGIPVHLVTVIDPLVALPPAYAYSSPALDGDRFNAIKALEYQGNEALHQAGRALARAGVETSAELLSGPVVRSIQATLREGDLLLLATRGEGRAQPDRFGDVATGLLRDATVPVVMFQPELPTSRGPSGHPEWALAGAA